MLLSNNGLIDMYNCCAVWLDADPQTPTAGWRAEFVFMLIKYGISENDMSNVDNAFTSTVQKW